MTPDRTVQLNDLKTRIASASYVVDPRKVAEAMLRQAEQERAARLLVHHSAG
jgi:anti-sigma28 factor (negative regulator of flagellin synthesis)